MPFTTLRLIEPLLRAVRTEGYTIPTDIQKQAIPHVLEGKDLLGCAQTGTGKTAAFALPILQRLYLHDLATQTPAHGHGAHDTHAAHETHGAHAAHDTHGAPAAAAAQAAHAGHGAHVAHKEHGRHGGGGGQGKPAHRIIRALVVTPTRELAAQIDESFRVYGQNTGLKHTVVYGGVSQGPQAQALRSGVDILVATPGRLLDLIGQRLINLGQVEVFVLDEADRMLDMGFIVDIRRIIRQLPPQRQNLMFSATMPREIQSLADSILRDPVEVRIAPEKPAAETVQQALYYVDSATKGALLEHLLTDPAITRALVFVRTKHGADKVARRLHYAGVSVEAIHSNKTQNARMRTLDNFKRGKTRVLIASDIASRGLDVDDISHVINYDLPMEAHTYVHRIGRTGRAGAAGQAITFCCDDQDRELRAIERLLGTQVPVLHHGLKSLAGDRHAEREARQPGDRGRRGGGGGGGRGGGSTELPVTLSFKSVSPEQKKEAFWKMRRKPRPLGFGRRR